MNKTIEVHITSDGFVYKGYLIKSYEDWVSFEDQRDVLWFGAEKRVENTWYWIKRNSLIELIEVIDNE